MSDNPFNQPVDAPIQASVAPTTPMAAPPQTAPGAYMTICILTLILAIFGLLASCVGTAFSIGGNAITAKLMEEMPPGQAKMQQVSLDVATATKTPTLIVTVLGMIVATMLLIGSIGGMRKSPGGVSFFRTALLAAAAFCGIRVLAGVYNYFVSAPVAKAGYEALRGDAEVDQKALDLTINFSGYGMIGGLALGIVMGLALAGFYLWARSYLGKPEVSQYLSAQQSAR